MIPVTSKSDVDGYLDQVKPHIKTLIKDQLKEMQPTKVVMTLWVRCRNPVKLVITLDPEHVEGAQDIGCNTINNYTRPEMPYNSLMTDFLKVVILMS